MVTEPHSANKSVALFTSKPMVFFERRNNQAHNNHIGQIVLQALEVFAEGMLAYCSCKPRDVD